MKQLGLYLHIPFCRSKCLYCDFCSFPHAGTQTVEEYVSALCNDLKSRAADCVSYEVDTVYFGGGTPTVLSAEQLERLIGTVCRCYHVSEKAEITAECNPATAETETFRRMRRAGFNRLSIGLQSAQEVELRALGRIHSFADFCRTWENALNAGFSNLSADVMFGIPHQSVESFADTLEKVCTMEPQHLSAYALTVEPGTPFGRRGETALNLPGEDAVCAMYTGMLSFLESRGLYQYEISNFARQGYESRHNLKYWNTEPYLGFGPAAHSDFGGARFGNAKELESYLAGKQILSESGTPSRAERLQEYVMLRMRLKEGLDLNRLTAKFGQNAAEHFSRELEHYLPGGFVRKTGTGYAFTAEGMLVSNAILGQILDFPSVSEPGEQGF